MLIGVSVMSWSKNCPYCMSMRVYLPCRWLTSACTTMDTRRGEGSAFPLSLERKRGREMAGNRQEE